LIISVPENNTKNEYIYEHIGRKPLEFIEYEVLFFERKNSLDLRYELMFCESLKVESYHGSDIGDIVMEE
jgi:glutamyl/glutaminyl-tRNA synthetase